MLGAAVGTAVLGRKVGPRAALWGAVCGTLPGHNHFTVLDSLAEGAGRLHGLALQLPGLRRVKTPDRVRVHAAPR